jgi:hypothetical protein
MHKLKQLVLAKKSPLHQVQMTPHMPKIAVLKSNTD